MKNKLIADAGGSKTDWALLDEATGTSFIFTGPGINPLQQKIEVISRDLEKIKALINRKENIKEIWFYGAGCATDNVKDKLKNALLHYWPDSEIKVNSDLLGAAVSLFGNGDGIACILGTGSNSCLYSNGKIKDNIPSLGYVLGDEGGGCYLGKSLINKVYKRQLSKPLTDFFFEETRLTIEELIRKVYQEPAPSRYLASFIPFIKAHIDKKEIRDIVEEGFRMFFKKNILPYKPPSNLHVGFVGGVAFQFEDILRQMAQYFNFNVGLILKSPIEGLISHHLN